LLSVSKLDNGQLEVDLPTASTATETKSARSETASVAAPAGEPAVASDERPPRRGRRGRGGRGRDREDREPRESRPVEAAAVNGAERPVAPIERPAQLELANEPRVAAPSPTPTPVSTPAATDNIAGDAGQRLTRSEAFDLVRRAVNELATADTSARASDVRRRARQLLGRDSESLSDRMFVRILKDAHDAGIIDLRRRGDDFEVARAAEAAPVAEQLARTEQAAVAASTPPVTSAPAPRIGMGHRGAGPRGRLPVPPPELLSIGVVETAAPPPPPRALVETPPASTNGASPAEPQVASRGRRGRGKPAAKTAAKAGVAPVAEVAAKPPAKPAAKAAKRGRAAAKKGGGARGKKAAPAPTEA
jgi:hypothetical protein